MTCSRCHAPDIGLTVCLQYNMVSAWVPAKFSAPKLLPSMPAWLSKRKQKTDAEPSAADKPQFRQVGHSQSQPAPKILSLAMQGNAASA